MHAIGRPDMAGCKNPDRDRLAVIRERSQLAASLLSQAQQLRLKENVSSHVETCQYSLSGFSLIDDTLNK